MSTIDCLVGRIDNTRKCGAHICFKESIYDLKDLSEDDLKNLRFRVPNFPINPNGFICAIHRKYFLVDFSLKQSNCCNPFNQHLQIRKGSKALTIDNCEELYQAFSIIAPSGGKLCISCRVHMTEQLDDWKTKQNNQQSPLNIVEQSESQVSSASASGVLTDETHSSNPSGSGGSLGFITESQDKKLKEESLKRILDDFELPMPKRSKLSGDRRQKISENLVQCIYEGAVEKVNDVFQTKLSVSQISQLQRDSDILRQTLTNIQSLYNSQTTLAGKIKTLTLLPKEYTYKEIRKYIKCSRYMLRKANKIKEEQGELLS